MWCTDLRQRWFGRFSPHRRAACRPCGRLRVRQLETRLAPSLTTLASFNTSVGGVYLTGLVMDSAGNLYGTTPSGGALGDGSIFELSHADDELATLASFDGSNGLHPQCNLLIDAHGNLYGTTTGGGSNTDGTVFELVHGSHQITTLASFTNTDGGGPAGGLTMDSSGNLYGASITGANPLGGSYGGLYELATGSSTITLLASFDPTVSSGPNAGFVIDSSGDLFGTTSGETYVGGVHGYGSVFELAYGSGTITNLATFHGANGRFPNGCLVMDGSGNLYGTTSQGGAYDYDPSAHKWGDGTVFELVKGQHTVTTLASFDGTDGKNPYAGLAMDSSGNVYGTADGGGYGYGTVFELARGSGTITRLAAFTGINGAGPFAGVSLDASDNLYGVTMGGGAAGRGCIFELPGALSTVDQWTGANSAVDTNWSDGANWSLGAPPTAGQTALFTNNASVQSFAATVDAGFTNPIAGLVIDSTWGGTITVNSSLTVTGHFTLASGSFGGSGAVTVGGWADEWTGGEIVLGSGGFTSTGTLTVDTAGGDLIATGAGTLTNDGTILETGTGTVTLENTATVDNVAGATFDIADSGSVAQSGGGTFNNAGTLEKTRGTGTATIATTTLDNTGLVAVTTGTLDISAAVTQVWSHALRGGSWQVRGSLTVYSTLDITSAGNLVRLGAGANVTLTGRHSDFTNLRDLATIGQGAKFTLVNKSFTTAGALTNNGRITLSPNNFLTVAGNMTQSSTGSLVLPMAGTDMYPIFGEVVSTSGTVSLGGTLDVTSTVVPAVGKAFTILENEPNSPIVGTFAGLPEGGSFTVTVGGTTMKFWITYAGADAYGNDNGDNNVVITRVQ